MTTHVGVVNIEYQPYPQGAIKEFVTHLSESSHETNWEMGGYHDVIVEYQKEVLEGVAQDYAKESQLEDEQRTAILSWVDSLPWTQDYVMLHINV